MGRGPGDGGCYGEASWVPVINRQRTGKRVRMRRQSIVKYRRVLNPPMAPARGSSRFRVQQYGWISTRLMLAGPMPTVALSLVQLTIGIGFGRVWQL